MTGADHTVRIDRRRAAMPSTDWAIPKAAPRPDIHPAIIIITGEDGRQASLDFSKAPCQLLVRELAGSLAACAGVDGTIRAHKTASTWAAGIRSFVTYLAATRGEELRVSDLRPPDIDGFECHERARLGDQTRSALTNALRIVQLLRRIESDDPGRLDPSLARRVQFGTDSPWPATRPLDAYSAREATVLTEAALADVRAARARIAEGRRLLLGGEDPRQHGWTVPNWLWLIRSQAVVTYEQVVGHGETRSARRSGGLGHLHAMLYPTDEDVAAFHVALGLITGLEPECVRELTFDCLRNADGGQVEVDTVKRRRHGSPYEPLRVRDGGLRTGGGLIRLAVTLTEQARAVAGSHHLWVHYRRGGVRESFTGRLNPIDLVVGDGTGPAERFSARHSLQTDDGNPLVPDFRRLRKTHMADRYQRAEGRFALLARNQSNATAATHYGDIPALADVHDGAVADALGDALGAAQRAATRVGPLVLAPDDELALQADPAAASDALSLPPAEAQAVLSGERDLWLSACKDFHNSPWGRPGQACPVPFSACLDCDNAVIGSAKLPAILAYLNHANSQRLQMSEAQWAATFGQAHARITTQILPRFPSTLVAEARDIAATTSELLYLPPGLGGQP